MQVFVPYPDLQKSVESLDPSRLGNQIYRECLTLARGKWPNHPVAKMWKYHTHFLCEYAFAGLFELEKRGTYLPDIFDKFHDIQIHVAPTGPPSWWGDKRVHQSHKANLLRKDYTHYSRFNWQYECNPTDVYYYPKIDLKAEARKVQPLIREFHRKRIAETLDPILKPTNHPSLVIKK